MAANILALVLVLLLAGCASPEQLRAWRMCERAWSRDLHLFDRHMIEGNRSLAGRDFDRAIASYTSAFNLAEAGRHACAHGEEGSLNRKWEKNFHFASSRALRALGDVYLQERKFEQAEVHFKRALAIREEMKSPESLVADVLNDLGLVYRRQGRYEEALPPLERAVRTFEKTGQQLDLAVALTNIGHVRDGQGRIAEAEAFFARALEVTETAVKPAREPRQSLQRLFHLKLYAAALRKSGKAEEAERVQKRMDEAVRRMNEEIGRLRVRGDVAKADDLEAQVRKILAGEDADAHTDAES